MKDFVTYEQALELKELGFDEPCILLYRGLDTQPDCQMGYEFKTEKNSDYNDATNYWLTVPTYSQSFRWFREKHNWQHSIEPTADQHSHQLGYNYWIWNYKTKEEYHTMPKNRPSGDWEYKTYEEAEQACLDKLIEICKNKTNE